MMYLLRTFSIISTSVKKIERGLKEIQEGRVLSQENVEERMSKWLER